MKTVFSAVLALAATAVFGGTGVTQRELTNTVIAVKGEITNCVTAAIGGLSNYVDTADTAVAHTAQGNLTTAVGHIMNFIEADLDDAEPTFNADGSVTIVHIDYSLGYPRRVKIRLRPEMQTVYSTKRGLKVVSSSYTGIPEGTLFACVGDGHTFHNTARGDISWEIATNTVSGSTFPYYHFYGTRAGGLILDSNNAYLTDQNQIIVYRGTANMDNLVGSFTVVPYWLSDAEFAVTAGSGATAATSNAWVERVTPTVLGWRYGFVQLDNLSAQKAAPRLFGAGQDLPTYLNIPSSPSAPKYNWNELYPLEDEDYYWEPQEWYKAEDWNHPYAWLTFPVQVSIPYEYGGETFTKVKVVRDLAGLQKYFKVVVPPTPYQSPQKKKKRDYCKEGQHIYVNCKCTKCGQTRAHTYEPCQAGDTTCAQCENFNTAVKEGAHGELVPDGDSEDRCTHICDEAIVDYHTGWHHEDYGEDDVYTCACQCGTYSASQVILAHNYEDESVITQWEDLHDGLHHQGIVECLRGECRHEKEVIKEHEVEVIYDEETGLPTNVFPYNDDSHVVKGDCTKCTAKDLDHHLEPHNLVGVGKGETVEQPDGTSFVADEAFCYCTICLDTTYHNYQSAGLHDVVYLPCGSISNCVVFCARCGYMLGHNEHDFRSENKYVDDAVHECYCGLDQHKHKINETSEKCEGGYHWVAEYNENGQEIGGNWVECETWVDDGCEHDFKEDENTGSGDIPCWCGKGANIRQHRPCGTKKEDGFQTVDDPCPPPPVPPVDPDPNVTGGWTIEWDDEITIKWMKLKSGPIFTTGIYPFPVQWGTKKFTGDSHYRPKSFRVMRYATWVEWWKDL